MHFISTSSTWLVFWILFNLSSVSGATFVVRVVLWTKPSNGFVEVINNKSSLEAVDLVDAKIEVNI